MKKILTKYFDVHVFFTRDNGYSVFVKGEFNNDWNDDDVMSHAINIGALDVEDIQNVDKVTKITKKEYEKSNARRYARKELK